MDEKSKRAQVDREVGFSSAQIAESAKRARTDAPCLVRWQQTITRSASRPVIARWAITRVGWLQSVLPCWRIRPACRMHRR